MIWLLPCALCATAFGLVFGLAIVTFINLYRETH